MDITLEQLENAVEIIKQMETRTKTIFKQYRNYFSEYGNINSISLTEDSVGIQLADWCHGCVDYNYVCFPARYLFLPPDELESALKADHEQQKIEKQLKEEQRKQQEKLLEEQQERELLENLKKKYGD